jgi:hypothetical protein
LAPSDTGSVPRGNIDSQRVKLDSLSINHLFKNTDFHIQSKDLNIDLGAKIPLKYTTDTAFEVYPALRPSPPIDNKDFIEVSVQQPYSIAIGATYKIFDVNLLGRVDFAFGGETENVGSYIYTKGVSLGAWLCANYRITPSFRVGLDFGYETHALDTRTEKGSTEDLIGSDYGDVGIGPWAGLNVGGGEIKIGLMVMVPNSPRYAYDAGNNIYPWSTTFTGDTIVSMPISFTYSF